MTNRKEFLRQSAFLAAGLLIAPSCVSEKKAGKKIGIQLYTLREVIENNVKDVLKKVSDIGYNNVETYGFSTERGFFGLAPKDFKLLLNDNNLISTSGHYDLEDFIKTGNESGLRATIEAANELEQEYVTVPYLSEGIRKSADDYRMIADKLSIAAEMAKEAGLKFAYHNHEFEFNDLGNNETGYKILLSGTDAELVQLELDLYWVVRSNVDPLALFDEHPGRFPMWHVKDMDKKTREINTEVGNGSIDFKSIFKGAEKAGVKHIFMEQENFSKDPFMSIEESYNYIKNELV